jgi:replicative DNA helicase
MTALKNLDAELGVIGSVIYDPETLTRFPDLSPEDFAEPLHARIFAAVLEKVRAGEIPEATGLAARFAADPVFDPPNPHADRPDVYLFFGDLIDKAPPSRVAEAMAGNVIEAAQRRALIELAGVIRDGAANGEVSAFDTLSVAERSLSSMVQSAAPASTTLVSARDAASATIERLVEEKRTGKTKGAMTGLRCFDRRLRGIQPSRLHIIGGRPSMGKTALARAAALGCAQRNPDKRVVYFCLEMDRDEMSLRNLSALTRAKGRPIAYFDMEGESLTDDQVRQIEEASAHIPANFVLDDSSTLTIEHVERRCFSLAKRGPLALIVVDYLQIMAITRAHGVNRTESIGEITGRLKRLAKALNCGVIALSQLSRGVEDRDSKRPMLSDLRDSGSIEQDANVVMFPFREAYYMERSDPPKGVEKQVWEAKVALMRNKMEVITAKFRGGAIGSDVQRYIPQFDYITDDDGGADELPPQAAPDWLNPDANPFG